MDFHFDDIDDLARTVEANGNVLTVPMWAVRDAYGADRLGRVVRENITKELAGAGLGSMPGGTRLPAYQDEVVRIFKLGSAVADLIDAARKPSESGDQRLREAGENTAAVQIEKIREIVSDD